MLVTTIVVKLVRLSVVAALLAASSAEPAPPMQVLSGSYVGNAVDDRFIYVGFQPDVVFLDRDDPANPDESVIRTATMPAGMSKFGDAGGGALALAPNVINSFDPGGFTIGTDVRANRSSITYHWVAFTTSPGELEIGSYTGNGTSQNITSIGFSPAYLLAVSEGAHNMIQKSSAMPASFSMDFVASGYTNAVDAFLPTGFSVGSNSRANTNSTVYHYVAWAALTGRVAVGTYNGNGLATQTISAPGFFPEWVVLSRSSNVAGGQTNAPVHKPASTGVSTDRSLLLDNNLGEANNIELLNASGFRVGSHTRVNDNAAPNFYHWIAFGPHRPRTNYRSIGTNPANLHAVGQASVPLGSRFVTFTSPLPAQTAVGAVGMGDVLVIQGETLYIEAYLSSTQVLLHSEATVDHSTPSSTFTITRAYNSLSTWENARDGDLVALDTIEVGVAYKDSPFQETLTIDAMSSDATHYMRLTVAPGQRHNGTSNTGVILDGQGADRLGIEVLESNTIVEWFEVTNHGGSTGFPSMRVNAATNVLFQYLLVRDFPDPFGNTEGIAMRQGQVNGLTVRNSMIYNGDAVGIEGDDADDTLVIENCTVYNMDGNGIDEKGGTPIIVTNTISMGNNGIDFDISGLGAVESYNMSDDGTANCPTCLPTENPLIQFVSAGTDHHLAGTSTAVNTGTDLSSSFCCDIDTAERTGTWDIGADEFLAVTAVELIAFSGAGESSSVLLAWETGSELDNLGFHLYRAGQVRGPYERITVAPIPGLGSSPIGAKYRHRDVGLDNGVTYFYRLEDIDTRGSTALHGPVAATPRQSATPNEPPVEVGEPEVSLLTFGSPEQSAFRVVRRDPFGVTLELETGGFFAVPADDGTVRLEIPGLEGLTEAGRPGLPVARSWIDVVAGRNVAIQSVRKEDVIALSGLRLRDAETPELEAFGNGIVRATRRGHGAEPGVRTRRGRAAPEPGLYPEASVRLVSVGFQGELKKVLVELAPLTWDGATGRVELTRRLTVRLSFRGRDRDEENGRRARLRNRSGAGVVARLATNEPGLYGVRFEDVLRGRAVATRELRLSRQGKTVPYYVDAPRFGRGATLYFVSEGGRANPYGLEAVYELELGAEGAVMGERSAVPSGDAQATYRHRAAHEKNLQYQPALLDAPDIWLWDLLFAPVTKSYPFEVSAIAPSEAEGVEPPLMSLWLQGASDFAADPDHHVRVYVNGSLVADTRWDGKEPRALEVELPWGALVDGMNQLELENVGDTAASYSMVLLNRFALEYSRRALAEGGSLGGRFTASGTATLSGLSAGARIVDTSTAPVWLVDAQSSHDGTLRFEVEASHEYLVVSPESVVRPTVTRAHASRWSDSEHQADYLVIGPSAFLFEAAPLLSLREEQGLSVEAVPIEEIYDAFGFGEPTPEAIRRFLAYAYHEWQKPAPRYVLLLGDATYDFEGSLGVGALNHVPPNIVRTSYLWTASDPGYAAVNGDDILPDVALGRLPAATTDELRVMVNKILAFESGGGGIDRDSFVLVADNPDHAGNFVENADALAAGVLASRTPAKVYLSALGLSATRSAIEARFDGGASLVSYIGHGGIQMWADENLLDISGVDSLDAQSSQPLLLTMNCLNGYFHFPYFDSLAEALVKADSKGAIAAFSPSGLSLNGPADIYHRALLDALVNGGDERLGDAVLDAQAAYAATGAFPELLSIYNLLGDPALKLR